MNRTITVAAAVAAVLASGSALSQTAFSGVPQANTINIMGSSAIKAALLSTIQTSFCQPSTVTNVTSNGTNTNFLGVNCVPKSGQASNSGAYNIFIRYEGGSVSGYLPIVNNKPVKEIGTVTAIPVTINGASTGNGIDDSFQFAAGGSFATVLPDLAIGDVEPKALIGNNYPSAYSTSVWGPVNNSGMFSLSSTGLVNEVYALFVNETAGVGTSGTTFTETPLNLSIPMVAQILEKNVSDWSQVSDFNGQPVGSGPIKLVNREQGSGSRAAADILIVGDGCGAAGKTNAIASTATQYFSTGDALGAANGTSGAITYATIDNFYGSQATKTPNMVMVTLNGVAPTNLNAANGSYPFWVEAQYINNAATTKADSAAINNIVTALQAQTTTAALQDINVIPQIGAANGSGTLNSTVHSTASSNGANPGGGTVTVYINPFTRSGVTCNSPVPEFTQIP
jgi:hypothetical protein